MKIALVPALISLFVMTPYTLAFGATEDCEAAYARAVNLEGFQSPAAGLRFYEGLKPRCGGESRYLSHLASLNYLAGQRQSGEKIIADGLAADPHNKDLLFSEAYVHLFHDELSDAEDISGVLMRTHPEWFGGYAIHQKILMDKGKFTDALVYGRKAVELSKGDIPLLFLNNAVASYHSQKYAEAVESVQIALSKDPTLVSGAWGVDEGIFALAKLGSRDQAFDLARRRKNADRHWREDANLVRVLKMIGEAD